MYFDYEGKNIEKYKERIYEVLRTVADREMSLDTMAYTIDRRLPDVFPKYLKRLDLENSSKNHKFLVNGKKD